MKIINYRSKKIAIVGYGLEGQDAEKYFKENRIPVSILDQKLDPYYLGKVSDFDLVVRSPGIYRFLPELVNAEKNGVIITSPIRLFFDECKAKIIGVTGTKGKGTTSTLIYEILKKAGKDVYLAGNIGKPYLELIPKLNSKSIVILEMSSFQLIDLHKSPHISVVLNITSDHMDWHKNQSEYVRAKENIVRHQLASDWAVINRDYKVSKEFEKITKAKVKLFSRSDLDKDLLKANQLRGQHNLENISAAVNVARILKINKSVIIQALLKFKGLEHRLELTGKVKGISFYNDSFSTNPQTTIAAIKSFKEPITIILGGYDKKLDYREMIREIVNTKNIHGVILIGDIRYSLQKLLIKAGYKGLVFDLEKQSMKGIVETAYKNTQYGGVVLLSPATSSFDMFENYKVRGAEFKKAVSNLETA